MTSRRESLVRERRFVRVHADPERIFDLSLRLIQGKPPEYLVLPYLPDLPRDVLLLGVNYEAAFRAFVFILAHETFDPVLPWAELPIQQVRFETISVPLRPDSSGYSELVLDRVTGDLSVTHSDQP